MKKEKKIRKKCNRLTLLPRVLITDQIPNSVRAPTSPIGQRSDQLDTLRKKNSASERGMPQVAKELPIRSERLTASMTGRPMKILFSETKHP
jgi:hypothetical protein